MLLLFYYKKKQKKRFLKITTVRWHIQEKKTKKTTFI